VLKKLCQQIAAEQQRHRENKSVGTRGVFLGLPERNRLRKNFNKGDGQHETGAEREQVFQRGFETIVNSRRKKNQAAQNICRSSKDAKPEKFEKVKFHKNKTLAQSREKAKRASENEAVKERVERLDLSAKSIGKN
jgi:hypothetical protein